MTRRILLLPLLLVLAFSSLLDAEDRRSDKSRLVVMTLNTLFMWDGEEPEEGAIHFLWKGSETEAEEHMEEIADIIIESDPDIVNLVEIENEDALKKLNYEFLSGRGYKPYFVQGNDTFTGQDLGVLTRIDPIEDIKRDDGLGESSGVRKGVSKNYYAEFDIDGKKIALVGLHFLARPNDSSRKKDRQAQADLIGKRAQQLAEEGYALIVLGDFNDYDGDVLDHVDSRPITNVLWRVRRMEYGNFADDLINVAEFVPKASRFTAFWDRDEDNFVDHPEEHTAIDHILISPSLRELVDEVEISHSIDPRQVTDHYPITLYLQLSDAAPTPPEVKIAITRILPNPAGNEQENEEVTVKNVSDNTVDLSQYRLRDLADNEWSLSGTIEPGETKTFKRNGQEMALNNDGDTIELLDPSGKKIQEIGYGHVEEGEEVVP